MALLDDPTFIIAHIRHAFITSDDTGMSEMAIMNEDVDWPHRKKELEDMTKSGKAQCNSIDGGLATQKLSKRFISVNQYHYLQCLISRE